MIPIEEIAGYWEALDYALESVSVKAAIDTALPKAKVVKKNILSRLFKRKR